MPARIDLARRTFGKLTVVRLVKNRRNKKRLWECVCSCGGVAKVYPSHLISGHTKSCGCFNIESHTKHGHSDGGKRKPKGSPTYVSWSAMISRCTMPSNVAYDRYGGRGISVCERWRSFETFLADMGERPNGTTIDRFPNRNGNYEPGNCRWATASQQGANRSTSIFDEDTVRLIHYASAAGQSNADIAIGLKTSSRNISRIVRGERWGHVKAKIFEVRP